MACILPRAGWFGRGHGGLYRQTSLDSADLREPTSLNSLAMARPSTSMTNLAAAAKTPVPELPARPGSALGIMSESSRLASLGEYCAVATC